MARDCRKYAPYHNSESTVSTYIRGIQGKLLKPILNFACFSIGLTRAHARGKVMGEERKEKKGPPISGFEDNSINTYFLQHLYWSIQYAGRRYRAALPGTHPIADIFTKKKRIIRRERKVLRFDAGCKFLDEKNMLVTALSGEERATFRVIRLACILLIKQQS